LGVPLLFLKNEPHTLNILLNITLHGVTALNRMPDLM